MNMYSLAIDQILQGPKVYKAIRDELCVLRMLVLRGNRIILLQSLRPRILGLAHEGHLGIVKSKQNLRTRVYWQGMEIDAEKLCKSCHGCQITSKSPAVVHICTTEFPIQPWSKLAADFLGSLPSGEYLLVVINYYSRWF